jgi:hypothetical protein
MGSEQRPFTRPAGAGGLFRLPSSPLFLGLLPVFSGQARLGDLSEETVLPDGADTNATGLVRSTDSRTFVISQEPCAGAETSANLLGEKPEEESLDLRTAVLRRFGPVGLKHLLGVFVAAEDAGADSPLPGGFVLDLNRHLDRLGYKRSKIVAGQKAHAESHLTEARSVLRLLCSSTLAQEIRLGPRRGTTIRIRFLLDEAASEAWHETNAKGELVRERALLREQIFLRVNPYLYSTALRGERDQQAFYTYQLRQLVRENAEQRPWVLILGTALPVRFGLNGGTPVRESVRAILEMGGISAGDPEVRAHVEQALKYMVEQGYLGAFETKRYRYEVELRQALTATPERPPRPRLVVKSTEPADIDWEETWRMEPPHYLPELLHRASHPPVLEANQSDLARASSVQQPMLPGLEGTAENVADGEVLRLLRERLGLSQGQLARTLGYTQAAISMAEAGKRPKMAGKILEAARRLRPGGASYSTKIP